MAVRDRWPSNMDQHRKLGLEARTPHGQRQVLDCKGALSNGENVSHFCTRFRLSRRTLTGETEGRRSNSIHTQGLPHPIQCGNGKRGHSLTVDTKFDAWPWDVTQRSKVVVYSVVDKERVIRLEAT